MADEQDHDGRPDGLAEIVISEKDFPITTLDKFAGTTLASRPWFAVYPGSEKLDLGDKKPVAFVRFESHAKQMIDQLWPGFGYYEPVKISYSDC